MDYLNAVPYLAPTMHHVTLDKDQKKVQLYKILPLLRRQNLGKLSKIIILTQNHMTSDYLSFCLNIQGTESASVHNFKSNLENESSIKAFNRGQTAILITDKVDFKVVLRSVQNIINYDMFIPNVLFFETNQSTDVFYNI